MGFYNDDLFDKGSSRLTELEFARRRGAGGNKAARRLQRREKRKEKLQEKGVDPNNPPAGASEAVEAFVQGKGRKLRNVLKARRAAKEVAGAGPSSLGEPWLKRAISALAHTKQVALSLTPDTDLVVLNNSAVLHGYQKKAGLDTSMLAACQGESRKSVGAADTNDTALTPGGLALSADVFSGIANATFSEGIAVFGWRIRVTGSFNNFAYRPLQIDVGTILGAAGPVQTMPAANVVLSLLAFPKRLPVDLLVLSVSNGAGLFSVVPGSMQSQSGVANTTTRNGIAARSLADANTFATFEGLNQRDLIARFGSCDGVLDEEEEDAPVFSGIRDAFEENFDLFDGEEEEDELN
jgi:hypothetical protein